MRRAAFFDMDKTLVLGNTGVLYARWRRRVGDLPTSELVKVFGWSLQYTFGLVDAASVSRYAALTLRGREERAFADACRAWVHEEVIPLIARRARDEVERARREGLELVVLTGSSPYIAGPLGEEIGIEHVLTARLAVEEGRFTGELVGPLCFAGGKIEAAEIWAKEHGVDVRASRFYTDSISDLPMLEWVREPRVVNPDPRLRWVARRRGWHVEEWR